jgi:hypothetical protein
MSLLSTFLALITPAKPADKYCLEALDQDTAQWFRPGIEFSSQAEGQKFIQAHNHAGWFGVRRVGVDQRVVPVGSGPTYNMNVLFREN